MFSIAASGGQPGYAHTPQTRSAVKRLHGAHSVLPAESSPIKIPRVTTGSSHRSALSSYYLRSVLPVKYIITGAGGGLGYELGRAILSSKPGAKVMLTYRSEALPDNLRELKRNYPDQVNCSKLELTDFFGIKNFAENYKSKYGHVDVLCSCAAIFKPRDPKENTLRNLKYHPEMLAEAYSSNSAGHLVLISNLMKDDGQLLSGAEQAQSSGTGTPQKFLIIGSAGSRFSEDNPKLAKMGMTYASSKAALHMGVFKAADEEKDNKQFIISCVDPGWIDTKMGGAGAPSGSTEKAAIKISDLIGRISKKDCGRLLDCDGEALDY